MNFKLRELERKRQNADSNRNPVEPNYCNWCGAVHRNNDYCPECGKPVTGICGL